MSDDDRAYPDPPNPNNFLERIIANPDVETMKMVLLVGILDSLLPDRRTRVWSYLKERYKDV